jgi:endonuclease/exonuclease/phosphatase family metal-dependent hydrolase
MADEVLRVVQLNAGSLLEGGWAERRHEIVAWLGRLAPDVVCLQEIWEDAANANTAGWLAERLGDGWYWYFGGLPIGSRLWPDPSLRFGSAVLSRWPIDAGTCHRLPTLDDGDPFVADVPWELVHVRTAGLEVFSCHLASAPTHALHRHRQVLAVDEHIGTAVDRAAAVSSRPGRDRGGMPPVLCGDFNAEPDSDEIRFLCGLTPLDGRMTYYHDAWRVAGDSGPGYTQDWRTNPIAAGLNVPRKRIDYVFVGDSFQRRGGAGRVLSAHLAFHEPLTGVLASDHAGLVVNIAWPERPAC